MADEKASYEVGEVATQTESVIVGPDGKAMTTLQAMALILNKIENIEKKVVG